MDDDYGTQDYTNESNSYSYDNSGRDNTYETDRNYDFTSSKENDYSTSLEQINPGIVSSSNETPDLDDAANRYTEPESQEIPADDNEDLKSFALKSFDLENVNVKKDEYSSDVNQESFVNANNIINESPDDDTDCCKCSNPLMCLAVFCDCFGL